MSFKRLLLRLMPGFMHVGMRDLYFSCLMLPNYAYDFRRYLRFSGMNKSRAYFSERSARITLFYHQVEKGLSLSNPRPGFGRLVIFRLMNDIDDFMQCYGVIAPATTAIAALENYVNYHKAMAHDVADIEARLATLKLKTDTDDELMSKWVGGVRTVRRTSLQQAQRGNFEEFFATRFSVRHFAGGPIPSTDIAHAVAVAQKTPSVCNRQSWRAHAYFDRTQCEALLAIQGGGRGFAEGASAVLVVSCELGAFVGVSERYQPWIDGGMFAMSLCLALHNMGYGSCCLNWSKEYKADLALRRVADLPDSEQVIMLIAVGTLPEEFQVACSDRPPVEHCLRLH